jgi:DNA repair protein RadD
MDFKLRNYQERCVSVSINYLNDPNDNDPKILVAPTAAGKSIIIAEIARRSGESILVLQPSKELLVQNHAKFVGEGFKAEIYSASVGQKTLGEVTFATLGSIKDKVEDFKFMGVRFVIIDECHFKFPPERGSMFRNFIDELSPSKVIGLTATPFYLRPSSDGATLKLMTRNKEKYFHGFIDIVQITELTSQGFWAELKYKLYEFDESGLMTNSAGSDFTDESIKDAMKIQNVNNKICFEIERLQQEGIKSILVFTDSVETAQTMSQWFRIKDATYIESSMPKKMRDDRVNGFKSGKYKVMCQYGILGTGFDFPDLRCVIMGRPTISLALYYQIIGRLTRVSPQTGKEYGLFVDFCSNAQRFGRVENLILEEIDEKMYMTSGDIVLTDVPMSGLLKTKGSVKDGKESLGREYMTTMPFGKHKGKKLVDLPIQYVDWLLNEAQFQWSGEIMQKLHKSLIRVQKIHEESKEYLKKQVI